MTRWALSAALIVVYVAASAAGLALMKAALGAASAPAGAAGLAERLLNLRFVAGFALYVAGFGVWMLILARLPLSVAFPLAAGALIVATQGAGAAALGERLGPAHLAGIALVLAGLVVIFFAGARATATGGAA